MLFTPTTLWNVATKAAAKEVRLRVYMRKVTERGLTLDFEDAPWTETNGVHIQLDSFPSMRKALEKDQSVFTTDAVQLTGFDIAWWKAIWLNLSATQLLEVKIVFELAMHGTWCTDECIYFSGFVERRTTQDDATNTIVLTTRTQDHQGGLIPAENIAIQYLDTGRLILNNINASIPGGVVTLYFPDQTTFSDLFTNPTLELFDGVLDADSGLSASFTGWLLDDTGGRLYVSTDALSAGMVSARLKRTSPTGNLYMYQTLTGVPLDTYTLSFWYRNNGASQLSYQVYDVTHSADIVAQTNLASVSQHTYFETTFVVPAGCTQIQVLFHGPSADGESGLFMQFHLGSDATTATNDMPLKLGEHKIGARFSVEKNRNELNLDGGFWFAMHDGTNILYNSSDGTRANATQMSGVTVPGSVTDHFPIEPVYEYLIVKNLTDALPYQWPYNESVTTVLSRLYTALGIATVTYGTIELGAWRAASAVPVIGNARYPGKSVIEAINETLNAFVLVGKLSSNKTAAVYARCDDDGVIQTSGDEIAITVDEYENVQADEETYAKIGFAQASNGKTTKKWDGTDWDSTPSITLARPAEISSELIADVNVQDVAYRLYKYASVDRVRYTVPIGILPAYQYEPLDGAAVTFTNNIAASGSGLIVSVEGDKDGRMTLGVVL